MFNQRGRSHIDQDELFRKIIRGHISLASMVEAIAVAEHKNFRKASRALKISQSSVSSRISSLEISIGYKIFDRQNGINITVKGRHFLSIIGEALALIGEAVQPNPEVSHVVERQLSLGIQSCSAGVFFKQYT
ncbi:LysR family transcriptional regulator [Gluconobacter thailandicus]|uniref:LysR family transcriptional regulator n=1 Tax=Gluconobacter thailandicus TaxID=257438 RepID=UPI0009B6E798|nr:LysR family transcriptional regulator [Gluconobacter thailandicus]